MTNNLDTLATARYVRTDDLLKESPQLAPWRPETGIGLRLSDAELVTLAVMQALPAFTSGLNLEEASLLLRNADVAVGEDDVTDLHRRTEGWPAGLCLAALYLREGGPLASAAASFGGDDRLVSEYMESEFLARITHRQRTFLTRTAVLERMYGPLRDAVLEGNGSAGVLAELERSNLLVPLDRQGEWYRYHHLFRDMLLAELRRLEPTLIPVLHQRAVRWHESNRQSAEALGYWMQAGEADTAACLVDTMAFPAYQQGRVATVERWFGWLDDHAPPGNYPAVAVMAAMICAVTGKPGEADRRAEIAEQAAAVASLPDGSVSIEPWLALMRTHPARTAAASGRLAYRILAVPGLQGLECSRDRMDAARWLRGDRRLVLRELRCRAG